MAAAMTTTRDCPRDKIALNYGSFTEKCENYVSANEETAQNIKIFLKSLYNVVKGTEEAEGLASGETLPELIVDNFDEEQIWQQLELQNEARVDALVGNVARLVAQKEKFATGQKSSSKVENNSGLDNLDSNEEFNNGEVENAESSLAGSENEFELSLDGDSNSDNNYIEEDDDDENDLDEDDIEADTDDDQDQSNKKVKSKSQIDPSFRRVSKPSVVDDKFFKLSEMEEFLEREEQENHSDEDNSSVESIDLFGDMPSDKSDDEEYEEDDDDDERENDKKKLHYADFFDAPDQEKDAKSKLTDTKAGKKGKVKFNLEGNGTEINEAPHGEDELDETSESDSETSDLNLPGKPEAKSSYEIRQERLQAKIKKLEDEALSDKPWQLRGEVSGEKRPENALLEEDLEFDLTHRPAPVVTEETTQRLEDIIKQRIKDKAWDDVERKEKPVEAPAVFKKKLALDQEKSKLSLSQVYEQEYLKQVEAANPDTNEKPEEIPKEHVEIKSLVDTLFRKLDALSNFHFTPKQVAPEVKIVTNIPAINMEEVAPLATSDATLLAPEEIKAKPKGDIKSAVEKTGTDRKRERRQKKAHQRLVAREREKREVAVEKLKPGLGNKYSKEKAVKLLEKISKDSNVSLIENNRGGQAVKSSTTFFSQLQDEVTSQIKEKTSNLKKRKKDPKSLSAKRLKL